MSARTAPRRTLLVAAMALLTAACGSTAAVDGRQATAAGQLPVGEQGEAVTGGGTGLTLSPSGSTSSPGGTAAVGTTGTAGTTSSGSFGSGTAPGSSSGTGSTGSATGGGTEPSQGPTPAPGQGPAATGRTGMGVTDDEIVVGLWVLDDSAPGNEELLGIEGVTAGDRERYYEIVRDHINERGGIAGRAIRYSIYRFTTAQGAQMSQLEQAACAHWTQDDPAYTADFTTSDNFLGCAEDAGLVTTSVSLTASDDRIFRTYPHHVEISSMSLTRQQPNLVAGLETQGYFDEGYQLGVVLWDEPRFVRAFEESLVPALAARGREVTDHARIKWAESNSDLGEISAQMQSTVLRFKTQGITHVTFIEHSAVLAFLFMTSAENQDYHPRYGLTSQSGNTTLAGLVPEGQLDGAVGIGWVPGFDVPPSERPQTQAGIDCLALFAEHGEEPANANNEVVMLSICERMFLIKAAVEAGLPDITNDSFMRGVNSLGGSYPSFTSFGNFFSPQRHDGAAIYRHVAYDPACVCFHYTSGDISDF